MTILLTSSRAASRALFAVQAARRQFRPPHRFGQPLEHPVGRAGDRDPLAVLGPEVAVRHGDEAAGSFPLADLAEHAVGGGQFIELAEDRFVDADVDDLTQAGLGLVPQRQHHADHSVQAGHVIAQRGGAGDDGRLAGETRQIGEPADGVRDVRETGPAAVRPGLPISRNAQHHEPRIGLAQHLPAQAPFLYRAGAEILHQDVGLRDQFDEELGALDLRRSMVTDFLLRASLSHASVASLRFVGAPNRRMGSPPMGCSTFSTSAPNSPMIDAA